MSGSLVRRLVAFLSRTELVDSASSSRFDLFSRRFSYALWRTNSVCSAAGGSWQEGSSDAIRLTDSCVRRMKELQSKAESMKEKMLRLSIESGGCAGFQYVFLLDDKRNQDDRVFEQDGVKLVVDNISYDFVKGATVDYVEELIRSAFQGSLDCVSLPHESAIKLLADEYHGYSHEVYVCKKASVW